MPPDPLVHVNGPFGLFKLLDSHSQNPAQSLHAKNEFYYKGNESIKLISL